MTRATSHDDEEHRGRWKRKPRFSFDTQERAIRRAMTSISNKIQVVQIERTEIRKFSLYAWQEDGTF